jgi:uncharacterized cupin superfamily protein
MAESRIVNINDLPLADTGNGDQFVARIGRAGPRIGSMGLGCTLTIVPPGKAAFPFHRHHVIQELFYILAGTGEYRLADERLPLRAGDLVAAPAGQEAHQIVNTSNEELRFLAFSTMGEMDIVEYPDSGKMAAAAGVKGADFRTATYRALGRITPADYYEGEGRGLR